MFCRDITQEMTQLNLKKELKKLSAMRQHEYMCQTIDANEDMGIFNIERSPEDIFIRRRIEAFMRFNHELSLDKVMKELKTRYKKGLANGNCINVQELAKTAANEQDAKQSQFETKQVEIIQEVSKAGETDMYLAGKKQKCIPELLGVVFPHVNADLE